MPSNASLIRKWKGWIRRIHLEHIRLATYREVFRGIKEIVRANPSIDVGNEFFHCFITCYLIYAAVAVRKSMDRDRRSLSLRVLLEDIRSHPQALTRKRLLSILVQRGMSRVNADKDIDSFGRMGVVHISISRIRADLARLHNKCDRLSRYVNKQAAHLNRHPLRSIPTYGDLNAAMNSLDEILRAYIFMIEGSCPLQFSVRSSTWKKIFTVPWIRM